MLVSLGVSAHPGPGYPEPRLEAAQEIEEGST